MKNIVKLLIVCLGGILAVSCTKDQTDRNKTGNNGKELAFTYILPGTMSVQTYAEALTHENRIYDLYVLFFDPSDGNTYKGCSRSGVSTTTTSGSSRVSVPENTDVMDAWELLFVANLEEYLLDNVNDAAAWLDTELANRDTDYAIKHLMGMSASPIQSPLLMSGQATKQAGTNEVSVDLERRVARIDLVNSASNFTLASAQVWNARTYAYLMEGGGLPDGSSANSFSNYTSNVPSPTNGKIEGKLYAFPNMSTPMIGDINTTCLIIGGTYTGAGGSGSVTYYRVNVCANLAMQQSLKGNNIYTIDITNVTGDGSGSPGDAHNSDNLQITYSINEWDDTYSILYVYDKDGNAMGVSQRFVNFSHHGPQEVDIQVFRIYSDSNPLGGDWSVSAPTGSYASSFNVTKQGTTHLTVEVVDENTLATDREATAKLTWGTIEISLALAQLSESSQLAGIQATPSVLSFPLLSPTAKEICLNMKGNYTGVTRADIETAIIYHDSGNTGWLTLLSGITPDEPDMGLFYFTVLPEEWIATGIREAEIKFVVRQGTHLSTTQAYVYQSPDSSTDGEMRLVELNCLEFDDKTNAYMNRGSVLGINTQITGLPLGQNRPNDIHFRMIKHEYIKYVMSICSSVDWEIKASGVAAQALNFSQTSGTGDYTTTVEIEITVNNDVEVGWDGIFYIEYEDGETTPVVVHQTGIIDSSLGDGVLYYYGLMRINGKLWLDRNIGASAPMDHDDPTVGYYHVLLSEYNTDPRTMGSAISYQNRLTSCPSGFRLGRHSTNGSEGEWDYIKNNIQFAGPSSDGTHPRGTYYLPYGSIDNPRYLYLPMINAQSGTVARSYYWAMVGTTSVTMQFNADLNSDVVNVTYNGNVISGSHYLRCVYDETL